MSYVLVPNKETKSAPIKVDKKEEITSLSLGGEGRSRGKVRSSNSTMSLPPGMEATPILGHKFRFQVLSDISGYSVTVGNLIGVCGVIGTVTNTTVASVASCVKVRGVTIWPALDATTNHSPEVAWSTSYGTTSDRSWTRTVPLGITITGSVKSKPKRDTLSSMWQNSSASATTLFTLYDVQKGSIVDVDLTYCQRNSQAGLSFTVTTAVLGTAYYLYLDGATGKLQPVALPNTL